MLDRIGDVHVVARDPGLFEALIEDAAGRTDERMPFYVLAVARLLADEHEVGVARAFAHDGLRGAFPQVAGPAVVNRFVQALVGGALWNRRLRAVEALGGFFGERWHLDLDLPSA
jgi:hypothetical protein